MKIILILFFLSSSIFAQYLTDWDTVDKYTQYAKGGENIILYFYSPTCPYCRKMNKKLEKPEIKEFLKKFKKIKISSQRTKIEKKLIQSFNIKGFPTLYFVNNSTKKLIVSGYPTGSLLKVFKRSLKKELKSIKSKELEPKIVAPKVDMKDRKKSYTDISNFYIKKKDYKNAIIYLHKLEKLDSDALFAQFELGNCNYYLSKEKKGMERVKLLLKAKEYYESAKTRSRGYLGKKEIIMIDKEINSLKNKK